MLILAASPQGTRDEADALYLMYGIHNTRFYYSMLTVLKKINYYHYLRLT